jgi:tetratricopeptide (TPR) repeat protein
METCKAAAMTPLETALHTAEEHLQDKKWSEVIRALEPFKSSDDLRVVRRLGTAHKHLDQLDAAIACFSRALEIARRDGAAEYVPLLLNELAGIYSTRKDFIQSFQFAREAAEEMVADSLRETKGPPNEPLDSLLQMAYCQIFLNNAEQADILLNFLQECFGARKELRHLARLESNLGNTALLRNDKTEALMSGARREYNQIAAQLREIGG